MVPCRTWIEAGPRNRKVPYPGIRGAMDDWGENKMLQAQMPEPVLPPGGPQPPPMQEPEDPNDIPAELPPRPVAPDPELDPPPPMRM